MSNIVSKTFDQIVSTTANIAENISEQFVAERENVSYESDSNIQLVNSSSVENISARNITQVADLGADTQGSSIEADQLYSGLRWLLQEWLPRQLDVVTLSEGGSHVLPSLVLSFNPGLLSTGWLLAIYEILKKPIELIQNLISFTCAKKRRNAWNFSINRRP